MSKQAQIIRKEMDTTKTKVCQKLNWTDMEYGQFQEATGTSYLQMECVACTSQAINVAKNKSFWSWWRVQWMKRDKEFLEYTDMLFPDEFEEFYKKSHHISSIHFTPHTRLINLKSIRK